MNRTCIPKGSNSKKSIDKGADSNIINIQSDDMYNNALYSGIGKTPFQPATQVVYTAVEHTTKDKHVIAVSTKNKLCSKKHSIMDSEKCVHMQHVHVTSPWHGQSVMKKSGPKIVYYK